MSASTFYECPFFFFCTVLSSERVTLNLIHMLFISGALIFHSFLKCIIRFMVAPRMCLIFLEMPKKKIQQRSTNWVDSRDLESNLLAAAYCSVKMCA